MSKGTSLAVVLLFLVGWIHRDISSGNILWYENRGLLIDLEYAKKFAPDLRGSSDPKTARNNKVLPVTSLWRY
jgi:hypothetical protein